MENNSLISRLRRAGSALFSSEKEAARTIDLVFDPSSTPEQIESVLREKQIKPKSKLDIRTTTSDLAYATLYSSLRGWYSSHSNKIPDRDDASRDEYLSNIWMDEPILAGAVYSMTAKMTALRWNVIGRRKSALSAARIFAEAAHFDGYDWGGFISSTAEDFYTTNRGVFWETPRIGGKYGKLSDLGHIDSLMCTLTANKQIPMIYASDVVGQTINFYPGEYIHFASLPSPRERRLGHGFCAVDRAFRAIQLLMAVHNYDAEKLSNLPPEGIASISGMTIEEFQDAIAIWKAQRTSDNSLTFPQVLWLIGSQPNVEVKVAIQGFSQIPESFNREQVVSHYISTLALDFGVDAREFWPISSGALGTSSESEIQHLKAKGKGPGEFISTVERHLNSELDDDTQFAFDTQDIEEDQNAAVVAKAWVDAYYPLYTGTPAGKSKASPGGKPNTEMVPDKNEIPKSDASGQAMTAAGPMGQPASGPEQVIDKDQLLRLLADRGVLPEWMMNDARHMITDTSIHISKEGHPEDYTSFTWDKGILKEKRLPPIIINSVEQPKQESVPVAEVVKEPVIVDTFPETGMKYLKELEEIIIESERDIKGDPIPEKEVGRGTRVTKVTLRDELERWRNHPILSKYALTDEELKDKLSNAS